MIVPNPSTSSSDSGLSSKLTTETNKMEAFSKNRKRETEAGERKKRNRLKRAKNFIATTYLLN